MASVKIKYLTGILVIISIVLAGTIVSFQVDKDSTSIYRDGKLLAQEKWLINGLSQNKISTQIEAFELIEGYNIIKIAPFQSSQKEKGRLKESFVFNKETESLEKFPEIYNVVWNPLDKNKNYVVSWSLSKVKNINLPPGTYYDCAYQFNNLKISAGDKCGQLDKVLIGKTTVKFIFKSSKGIQEFNPIFIDPELIEGNDTIINELINETIEANLTFPEPPKPIEVINDTGKSFSYNNIQFNQIIELDGKEDNYTIYSNNFVDVSGGKELITDFSLFKFTKDLKARQKWILEKPVSQLTESSYGHCESIGEYYIDNTFTKKQTYYSCTSVNYAKEIDSFDISFIKTKDNEFEASLIPNKNKSISLNNKLIIDPVISTYVSPTLPDGVYRNVNWFEVNLSTNTTEDNYAFVDWNRSLVLWQRFENDSTRGENATFFNDESSWSNNGTCSGTTCPTFNSSGMFGATYSFNNSQFINLGKPQSLNITGNITISTWFYVASLTGAHTLFGKFDDTGKFGYGFRLNGNSLQFFGGNGTSTSGNNCDYASYVDEWHHIAGVKDSINSTIYIDGVSCQALSYPYPATPSNVNFQIGVYPDLNTQFLNGSIDDVQVYSRALSSSEILSIYDAAVNQYYNNFTSLADGTYTYTGYSVNTSGAKAQTIQQSVTVDTTFPTINFTNPTPANNSLIQSSAVYINITSSDTNPHYIINDWNRSLVLWQRFENDSSRGENATFFNDESSYSSNGTCSGTTCPNFTSSGKWGNAITFDGINDYINITGVNKPTSAFTISAWVYPNALGSLQTIIAEPSGIQYSKFARIGSDGTMYLARWLGNANQARVASSVSAGITAGSWQHIVVVYNGTESGSFQVYVNKVAKNPSTVESSSSYAHTASSIGGLTGGTQIFNGTIDDLQIYSRVLSSQEINASFNASTSQYYNNFTGLVDGVYTTKGYAVDQAGNKNSTETRKFTSISSFGVFSLIFIPPFNGTDFIYVLGFETNLTNVKTSIYSSLSETINLTVRYAPNILAQWDIGTDNYFETMVKNWFGVSTLSSIYNRTYGETFMLNQTSNSSQTVRLIFNLTNMSNAYATNFVNTQNIDLNSLLLIVGTPLGGPIPFNSSQTEIPISVGMY